MAAMYATERGPNMNPLNQNRNFRKPQLELYFIIIILFLHLRHTRTTKLGSEGWITMLKRTVLRMLTNQTNLTLYTVYTREIRGFYVCAFAYRPIYLIFYSRFSCYYNFYFAYFEIIKVPHNTTYTNHIVLCFTYIDIILYILTLCIHIWWVQLRMIRSSQQNFFPVLFFFCKT